MESKTAVGEITATIDPPRRTDPRRFWCAFRHPEAKPIRSVSVNGSSWTDFDAKKEWVSIAQPTQTRYVIINSLLNVRLRFSAQADCCHYVCINFGHDNYEHGARSHND